jgi:hypothetical protein
MALPVLSRAGVLAGWLNGGYGRWLAGWLAARQQQRNTAQQEHQEEDDKEASIHPASRPVRRRMPCDPTVTEPAGSCRQLAVLVPALGADLRCHIFFCLPLVDQVSVWAVQRRLCCCCCLGRTHQSCGKVEVVKDLDDVRRQRCGESTTRLLLAAGLSSYHG